MAHPAAPLRISPPRKLTASNLVLPMAKYNMFETPYISYYLLAKEKWQGTVSIFTHLTNNNTRNK
jgi:hypothetical protein